MRIGEVAELTGISVSTLRSWERRYGYPRPLRLDGGHRRYDADTVKIVEQAMRHRLQGLSVRASLEASGAIGGSLVRTVRALVPGARSAELSRRAMLAVSRAIEDEVRGSRERPVVFGSFQRPDGWIRASARWRKLAPRTTIAVAVAPGLTRSTRGRLCVMDVPGTWPCSGEWAVISDGGPAACVVAAETGAGPNAPFVALWSTDPGVVRSVSRALWWNLRSQFPDTRVAEIDRLLDAMPVKAESQLAGSTTLNGRIVQYLDMASGRQLP